jgi:hypothetical protein
MGLTDGRTLFVEEVSGKSGQKFVIVRAPYRKYYLDYRFSAGRIVR